MFLKTLTNEVLPNFSVSVSSTVRLVTEGIFPELSENILLRFKISADKTIFICATKETAMFVCIPVNILDGYTSTPIGILSSFTWFQLVQIVKGNMSPQITKSLWNSDNR